MCIRDRQDGDLHLVVVLQKADGFLDLEVDVVFTCLWAHANLFELGLMSFVLGSPLTLVVFELSIVHDSTNGRLGFRSDFDQIEPLVLGFLESVCC